MTEYSKSVRRFGGSKHRVDEDGIKRNISHKTDFPASNVQTDGVGNIISMPLLKGKPCFARPERHHRGIYSGKKWTNGEGESFESITSCTRCIQSSPGVFAACAAVADERVASDPELVRLFGEWLDISAGLDPKRRWIGRAGSAWGRWLTAIELHGGWTNVNDLQVRAANIQSAVDKKKRKNEAARDRRAAARRARRGERQLITKEFLASLEAGRQKRTEILRAVRMVNGGSAHVMLRFKNLTDDSCARIASTWWARELLMHHKGSASGKEIAEILFKRNMTGVANQGTLQAHVSRDLKRIASYEDDSLGEPLWPKWEYVTPRTPVI